MAVSAECIDLLSGEPKTYGVVLNAELQGEMSEFEWEDQCSGPDSECEYKTAFVATTVLFFG
jgi:hypothetical protein